MSTSTCLCLFCHSSSSLLMFFFWPGFSFFTITEGKLYPCIQVSPFFPEDPLIEAFPFSPPPPKLLLSWHQASRQTADRSSKVSEWQVQWSDLGKCNWFCPLSFPPATHGTLRKLILEDAKQMYNHRHDDHGWWEEGFQNGHSHLVGSVPPISLMWTEVQLMDVKLGGSFGWFPLLTTRPWTMSAEVLWVLTSGFGRCKVAYWEKGGGQERPWVLLHLIWSRRTPSCWRETQSDFSTL